MFTQRLISCFLILNFMPSSSLLLLLLLSVVFITQKKALTLYVRDREVIEEFLLISQRKIVTIPVVDNVREVEKEEEKIHNKK